MSLRKYKLYRTCRRRMSVWPCVPEEQMTTGARQYLAIVSLYMLSMAFGLFVYPEWFASAKIQRVVDMVPFQLTSWGIIHLFAGGLSLSAAWTGNVTRAFRALFAAFVVVGLWAMGFLFQAWHAIIFGGTASWAAAAAWPCLALTHLVISRRPIRFQLDPVVRELNEI